jgi:hypothetical protein
MIFAVFSAGRCVHADWIRPDPAKVAEAQPIWGIAGGMSIGLWPTPGPRGLIRIYTPYLGQPAPPRMINFIAVEPIVGDDRSLSEMESSQSDGKQGKRMWTSDSLDADATAPPTDALAQGKISRDGSVEQLQVVIHVERFNNGAEPIVVATFRSDRPNEVQLQTFAATKSVPLRSCVLSATMGNWARLRHLHLKDRTIESSELFRGSVPDRVQFFPHFNWPSSEMLHEDGRISASATGDIEATTPDDVPSGWHYVGDSAVQTWETTDEPGTIVQVNGRKIFWGTHAAIPGGMAFENFELVSPFRAGQAFVFRVTDQIKS